MSSLAQPKRIGRYLLYGPIAAGGMATVHFGRLVDGGFARTVAIKRLRTDSESTAEQLGMLSDEARILSRVHHPNVAPILDVLADEHEILLVMDYIAGASLSSLQRASRGAPIEPAIACSILVGVLHGLHAAHGATSEHGEPLGIVHRDVSPQNILVGIDGLPRLVDFGVAKARGRQHSTFDGRLKGKIAYMSPEQINGAALTLQSDVFSAGVVLWEALTGRRLFTADNEGGLLSRVLESTIEPPSRVGAVVSPLLDAIVLRALERNVAARFSSAEEFANALERNATLAPAGQVAAWVRHTAAESLAAQLGELGRVEASSLPDSAPERRIGTPPSRRVPASGRPVIDDDETRSEAHLPPGLLASAPPPAPEEVTVSLPRRRRDVRRWGIALAALAAVVVVGVWLGRVPPAAKQVEAGAMPSTIKPPSNAHASAETVVEATSAPVSPPIRRAPPRRPPPSPKNKRCDPPYTIGKDGIQRLKPECM
jgi:serine/threonine-protein kinase